MTYLYYKQSSTWTGSPQVDDKRRETLEGAESAIDGSIEHFTKKLEATKGPKVVKTFK